MQRVKISVLLLIGLGVVLIVIQNTAPATAAIPLARPAQPLEDRPTDQFHIDPSPMIF